MTLVFAQVFFFLNIKVNQCSIKKYLGKKDIIQHDLTLSILF